MKKRKPETTSKKVASDAAKVMNEADEVIQHLLYAAVLLEKAKSVAASALTQREK